MPCRAQSVCCSLCRPRAALRGEAICRLPGLCLPLRRAPAPAAAALCAAPHTALLRQLLPACRSFNVCVCLLQMEGAMAKNMEAMRAL